MDEQQIAEQVAKRYREQQAKFQPVTTESPATVVEPTEVDTGYVFDNPLDELSMLRLYDHMNIPMAQREDPKVSAKMSKLIEWATTKGAKEYYEVIAELRRIEATIADGSFDSLYRFVKIDLQRQQIDNEMKALYG